MSDVQAVWMRSLKGRVTNAERTIHVIEKQIAEVLEQLAALTARLNTPYRLDQCTENPEEDPCVDTIEWT